MSRAMVRLYFHLVRRFDLAPMQGAALWVVGPRVETGLKPWAESSGPFGAQISGRELLARGPRDPGESFSGVKSGGAGDRRQRWSISLLPPRCQKSRTRTSTIGESDATKGLKDSAQGFNPGNPSQNRFALKGREMRPPDESRTILPRQSQGK
jgi:hypothetical protein